MNFPSPLKFPDSGNLELRGLTRTFVGPVPVHALIDVNIQVDQGSRLAILGRSGSGKSTLLNILGLLDIPTSGTYSIGGIDTRTLGENDRTRLRSQFFGFVFQDYNLLEDRTSLENVELPLRYTSMPRETRLTLAQAALRRVGLGDRIDALANTLSGGEAQRVAIARAIVHSPRILLCDEPTGNLDTTRSESIMEIIGEIANSGVSVIVVTHDVQLANRFPRRVLVEDGHLRALL